jgi:hypothetical protein
MTTGSTTTCITKPDVNARLKRLIASIKNVSSTDILLRHTLITDLGFTDVGVRALAVHINTLFADVSVGITPDEASGADTVGNLATLIWDKVPNTKKC